MISELPRRIERLLVSPGLLERSRELLAPSCHRRVECCLLWYGYVLDSSTCLGTTCVRPSQHGDATTYSIATGSMREARQRLRAHRLLLLAQIHSHPTRAFFSTCDEQNALNKQVGALNMIVPDYGDVRWIDTDSFCMVERDETGHWTSWSRNDWDRLVIIPDVLASGVGNG
jgi:hypothetical protein